MRGSHFYIGRPPYTYWRSGVSQVSASEFDPVVEFPFRIGLSDRVATAGSCFAQHIARHLSSAGFNYLVTEAGHPIAPAATRSEYSYGLFSARYGNIYSSRQMLQLLERAYGRFRPAEDAWRSDVGRWHDPFRPTVEPNGFCTIEELRVDREQHLSAVRAMFENLDYLIFTLGLTECWVSSFDGAAFPVCPGVVAGTFSEIKYSFVNLSVEDVISDLEALRIGLRDVNPRARIILTVSPVPLAATAERRHVWVSTTASKAILRAACDSFVRKAPDVGYFPSFEIITSINSRGAYYAEDLRSVTEDGVSAVMRSFFRHATHLPTGERANKKPLPEKVPDTTPSGDTKESEFVQEMREVVQVLCDEQLLDSQ